MMHAVGGAEMRCILTSQLARLVVVPTIILMGVSLTGCQASFCAGSGCDSGKVYFGSNYSQPSGGGGAISVVGKTDTFKLGQKVAMVANLSENAGAKTLTLEITGPKGHRSVPYHISSTSSNELANVFTRTDLASLGVSRPGSY